MQMKQDEQLCMAAQAGNETARAQLVARYVPLVGVRASAYLDRTNGFERDDLGQEGFIGLLCAIEDYRADMGASFKTFAALCIDRKICDAVKAALRKRQVPDGAKVELDSAVQIGTPSAESEVIAKDELSRLMQRMENCASPYERQAFLLFLRGHSYKEIAQLLNCSQKSVENALGRVRKKLADDSFML